jgi:hypothetical protein
MFAPHQIFDLRQPRRLCDARGNFGFRPARNFEFKCGRPALRKRNETGGGYFCTYHP